MSTTTPYAIAILGEFYAPDIRGERTVRFVTDADKYDLPVLFDTAEDAKSRIDDLEEDVYYLAHNEAGRPEYVILSESIADHIRTGRGGDQSNYDWDAHQCDQMDSDGNACGECSACIDMMIDQDRGMVRANAVIAD